MDKKSAVVDVLERLSLLGEISEANPFKVRAWQSAARTLSKLEGDLGELYRSGALAEVKGVGKGILEIVGQVVEGRPVPGLLELEQEVPAGLLDVMRLPGIGPKKARALWKELGVTTLAELEYAVHENRLADLKGFGDRSQAKIREALLEAKRNAGRLRLDEARAAAGMLAQALSKLPGVARVEVVGDLRRATETVDRIELLALGAPAILDRIAEVVPEAARSGADGLPGIAGRLGAVAVHVHAAKDAARFGAALVVTTGSAAHVEALRRRASERGLALEASGLTRGEDLVPCADEEQVYDALGLLPQPVEQREGGAPLVEKGKARPRLVERRDLRGALHNHTTASDGTASLEEMRAAAIARGLSYLGVSDHSKSSFYASGLPDEALLSQAARIAALNQDEDGARCRLLRGTESDILGDGALDYGPEVLVHLDFVVASVHSRLGQKRDEMTERMRAAASNPFTTLVGHPTGRLLLGRKPSDYDMAAFLDACAQSGCAVELNAHPSRLDLCEEHLRMAKERGVLVSIGADAHSTDGLDDLEYGVAIARRAGLTPEDVLNARPLEELLRFLEERKARAASSAPA